MKKPYSVIFLRPQYLSDEIGNDPNTDTYIALVKAESIEEAANMGRDEVFAADKKDKLNPESSRDYHLLFILRGHVVVELYGWQA